MHASLLLPFLAVALASPLQKRDAEPDVVVVTDVEVDVVTVWVTETAAPVIVKVAEATAVAEATTTTSTSFNEMPPSRGYWHHRPAGASTSAGANAYAPANTDNEAVSTALASATIVTTTLQTNTQPAATVAQSSTSSSSSSSSVAVETEVATTTTVNAVSHVESSSSSSSSASDYESLCMYHHNVHRANHSASDLTWNTTLVTIAQEIAESCVYEHNTAAGGGGYGQNIAGGVTPANIGQTVSNLFYNGEEPYYEDLYGEASPDMTNFEKWGHFSQIVWNTTESVGCYTQYCSGGLVDSDGNDMGVEPYFTVCNYYPPGNYAGEYTKVQSPLGHDTVSAADAD